MRVAVTGGGTGGHITPALAVIDRIQGIEVLYVGEASGLEERLCKEAYVPFSGIKAGKLRRYFSFKNFLDFFKVPVGVFQAWKVLRTFKPDVLFAKGGYVSLPVVMAARMLRVPVVAHESDVTPGLTTRLVSKFASKILLSWDESKEHFKMYAKKSEVVGNPVREMIFKGTIALGKENTGFSSDLPVVMIMGGSGGAQSINELVWTALPELIQFCQVIHVTGPGKIAVNFNNQKRYQSFEYVGDELPDIYAITDLVVGRAGASSIAEWVALGLPSILIPLGTHASRGDQLVNAEMCRDKGWSEVFREDGGSVEQLVKMIRDLVENKERRKKMHTAMSATGKKIRGAGGKIARMLKSF
jgi:UDP-N-acetylglucosamine--N-acetylmuramyl-(pentapeptide) pyrophosphoryl-undecaprenol N-acetylglucosamine transferase